MSIVFDQVIRPAYLMTRSIGSRVIDRRFGITTTDELVARELGEEAAHFRRTYRALPFRALRRLMRWLDPVSGDVLLDMGCGAGRVICMAAQYPFDRVVGIEINQSLCALAERNVQTLRRFKVRPSVVCTNAVEYRVPDDVTVLFLYNPFQGAVLKSALTRVLESFDRSPRRLRIVYANPREHELVMSMGRFRETGCMWASWRPGTEWGRTQLIRQYDVESSMR